MLSLSSSVSSSWTSLVNISNRTVPQKLSTVNSSDLLAVDTDVAVLTDHALGGDVEVIGRLGVPPIL